MALQVPETYHVEPYPIYLESYLTQHVNKDTRPATQVHPCNKHTRTDSHWGGAKNASQKPADDQGFDILGPASPSGENDEEEESQNVQYPTPENLGHGSEDQRSNGQAESENRNGKNGNFTADIEFDHDERH
jgi:hypothetical protein